MFVLGFVLMALTLLAEIAFGWVYPWIMPYCMAVLGVGSFLMGFGSEERGWSIAYFVIGFVAFVLTIVMFAGL